MNIQWYPGHMTKAKRKMAEDIKLVDIVIELLDARAPLSTENPDIAGLSSGKKRLIILNKSDLADETATGAWVGYFKNKGFPCLAVDGRNSGGVKTILKTAGKLIKEKRERDLTRGITGTRPIRAMVVGIPNVGKSTFINSMLGKSSLKTADRPGVTRGNQWINIEDRILMLDTPGVLWPRIESEPTSERLAILGSINDNVFNEEELALKLIEFLLKDYPELICKRFPGSMDLMCEADGAASAGSCDAGLVLKNIAEKRGAVKEGHVPDIARASGMVLDDFRKGRIGRISLERPDKI